MDNNKKMDSGLGTLAGFHIMGEIMIRALSRFAAPALALPRAVKRGVVLALDAGWDSTWLWGESGGW